MIFDEGKYSNDLQKRIEQYALQIERLFGKAVGDLVRISLVHYGGGKMLPKAFFFGLNPKLKKEADAVFKSLADQITTYIVSSQQIEWLNAGKKNDDLIKYIFRQSNRKLPKELLSSFHERNLHALSAFQSRKQKGLGLSDRIWEITEQFKAEMEMALDLGIGEGKSAARLAPDIQKYLKEPDRLFRRVRDKHGNLRLSQAAKSYHPGRGIYRSSFKNAARLTRTVINESYRESDNTRRDQLPFVVGIEVRLSNNPNHCPVCVALAGKYPKTFRFRGWHPHCRCHTVSILMTQPEMDAYMDRMLSGKETPIPASVNQVNAPHAGFTKWIKDNAPRIQQNWKSAPWWMEDNKQFVGEALKKPVRKLVPKKTAVKADPEFKNVPEKLSEYETKLKTKVNREIFNHLPEEIELKLGKGSAYYHSAEKYVNIPIDARRKASPWYAEAVIYHEFGHAVDFTTGLKYRPEVKEVMDKYRKRLSKNDDRKYIKLTAKMYETADEFYSNGDMDGYEKSWAVLDTIMSLNKKYGDGHRVSVNVGGKVMDYFDISGNSEAEFLAHAFENFYAGNDVFKKAMPGLYRDMRSLMKKLLKKPKQ